MAEETEPGDIRHAMDFQCLDRRPAVSCGWLGTPKFFFFFSDNDDLRGFVVHGHRLYGGFCQPGSASPFFMAVEITPVPTLW